MKRKHGKSILFVEKKVWAVGEASEKKNDKYKKPDESPFLTFTFHL